MDRRTFITRAGLVSAAAATGTACSSHTAPAALKVSKTNKRFGNPLPTEAQLAADGSLSKTAGIRTMYTRCFTCNNMCGLRVRIDEASDTVLKVGGNPYCEVNSGSPFPLSMPVRDSYAALAGNQGLENRATTCGKGASGVNCVDDPRRVTQVLKRAGKRGEGKWISISYEQALKEILDGGDLFGEGQVDGLRAIRQLDKPAVPGQPEFGSAANRLFATFNEEDTLRGSLYARFMRQAYGTANLVTKHAYCGAPTGIGFGIGLNPGLEPGLSDIDWDSVEYALFLGTAPGASGASLNRLGRGLADARTDRKLKYTCVDPLLRTTVANDTRGQWLPIKPGRDSAFAFALIQIMLSEGWFDAEFLSIPNAEVAKAKGEVNRANACHLVVMDESHPGYRKLAKASDFGLGGEEPVVVSDGQLVSADKAQKGELFTDASFTDANGQPVRLAASLALLKQEADRTSLSEYANACGISETEIRQVAKDLSHHGRRACVATNTGANSGDAIIMGWLIATLNTLIGAHDAKGGAIYGNGAYWGFEGNYNLGGFDGEVDTSEVINVCRAGAYEGSTEYQQKLARGDNPYPASDMWHNLVPGYAAGNAAEALTAHTNGNPYSAKALVNWRSNALYSASSINHKVEQTLADPARLPLFVAIDCYMNETNRYADYFIPDRVMFEEYAADRMWGAFNLGVVAGAPLVTPRTVKNAAGHHVCMEQFVIDLAMAMSLPGFGKGAIAAADGRKVDLLAFEDWHARYLANVAAQCSTLPAVSDEDRQWAALDYSMTPLRSRLNDVEASQVEALLSRGGYYESGERYDGDFINGGGGKLLQIYNADMAQLRHCHSGEYYPGTPVYQPNRFWNGDSWEQHWPVSDYPLLFSSYKPTLRSNYSAAFDRCAELTPTNFVYLHSETAAAQGLKNGDTVRVISGNGTPAEGVVQADSGVAKGAVCVSHTFGHKQAYGADSRSIDGQVLEGLPHRGGGTAVNQMVPHDPTRPGEVSMLNDYYAGTNCRHGIPVRIEKVNA
ncbi:molybdopterin dinucleotide binding domain-containing protein [Ferrimonas sp. SCSIO 43195]|uniref:molybdopterin dinucleotide binding domain-containing protein n=1 Tax=Ferrimonas sp. SCSIO 43195 TaxID=2822844 RepID=UPI00207636F0|nr:molybdopterin dinucleotide binding domain-containing protein [Ferrimonas sp. SCSIO 43195]USD39101.1 tetrathionate reductase subunit TtrA [Ferrimonas sp. SCSIO 43195]